ncbi:Adenylyl-sulfate kinase [Penicillium odoratum]|uniref:Adenylyl-sulfate kinase n=1 Tax=Penicillium odoratum TaxID=1167516 RepID=UPI002548F443|nr:Adenylyl-sulfate kinase [Penicillium odoratum]KAJ5759956.1 Adenylyl-sulfate kinase [Penicillium odoratum]
MGSITFDPDLQAALEQDTHIKFIRNHPTRKTLSNNPDFQETSLHTHISEDLRNNNLITGTLAGPQKVLLAPFTFKNHSENSIVMFMYLGSGICGHPGIVHGGVLATLLDEALARCCFPVLPNKVGVTANLNIDYRAPVMANSYVVLRARTKMVEGRKAWVEGRIETLDENGVGLLVEATALFIEPRRAETFETPYKGV